MEFFKKQTRIDFMALRKRAALFSILICLASLLSLSIYGLHLGLDFKGGTQVELGYPSSPDLNQIREQLSKQGFSDATVQAYGSAQDILVRFSEASNLSQEALTQKLQQVLSGAEIKQIEFIGPQVGKALLLQGVLAIFISLIAIMVYILFRFEYRFAVSAVVALIHDPIVILGIFSAFHIEFNLIALAALMTIIGYSLNDTIVVYDRVRENFRKMTKGSALDIMNLSINQTLSRTIMTSGLTLLVVLALLIWGGEMLFGFSLALLIGILVGTYSSIYVAGGLAVAMGLSREHLLKKKKVISE